MPNNSFWNRSTIRGLVPQNNVLLHLPGTNSESTCSKRPTHCPKQSSKETVYCLFIISVVHVVCSNKEKRGSTTSNDGGYWESRPHTHHEWWRKKCLRSFRRLSTLRQTEREREQELPEVMRPEKRWRAWLCLREKWRTLLVPSYCNDLTSGVSQRSPGVSENQKSY